MGNKTKVILISGKAQNGKDTIAQMIKSELDDAGKSSIIAHYGDLVKYVCEKFFGWDGMKDDYGRSLLQRVGTDVVRAKDEDYWARFIEQMLRFFEGEWEYVMIPDCRFQNEIDAIHSDIADKVHIRVVRGGSFVSPLTQEQQRHPSETALDDCVPDVLIYNDGSLNDLQLKIRKWVKENV